MAAAAAILERDGYDALTMRAVAGELGVQAASLYRHVDGRSELIDLLFDHLMEGCAPKLRGADWRQDLAAVAGAWRRRLVSRRDATRIALGQVSIGPNIAPLMEGALDALRRSGLGEPEIVEAYQACVAFVHGFASAEASQKALAAGADGGPRIAPLPPDWAAEFPTLSRLGERLSKPPDPEASFAFGLAALIAGIGQRVAAGRP